MRCARPGSGVETLDLRSGGIFDFLDGPRNAGESQVAQRRVTWLCDARTRLLAVETWGPPGEQVRPSGSLRARLPRVQGPAEPLTEGGN